MKAELIYGRLIKVEDGKVTLQVKDPIGERKLVEYSCDFELVQEWVADHLGDDVVAVLIDGKIKNFR